MSAGKNCTHRWLDDEVQTHSDSSSQFYVAVTIYVKYCPISKAKLYHYHYSCSIWCNASVLHVNLYSWFSTCSHLLIHRRHCAADAGPWSDETSRPRPLSEGIRGTASRRSPSKLWLQLHLLTGHIVDLEHRQVRGASVTVIAAHSFDFIGIKPQ